MTRPADSARTGPILSVITAAYNAEAYLSRCIESVLTQTFRDLELLVVDDGSTDGTGEIIARYAAADTRVHGFRGPNRGVSHARNVAMRHARGRYFALLDADDEWQPTFAVEQLRVFRRNPDVAIVSGNGLNRGGPLDGRPVRPYPAEPRTVAFLNLVETIDSVFIMSVFKREVFEAIGGFNESLHRSEDYEFWLRATAAGFIIRTNPQPLAFYHRRPDSASADEPAMFDAIIHVLRSAREFRKRPRTDELGAIDRQLEQLSAQRLLTLGKAALLRQDFVEARAHFRELHRLGRGVRYGAVAAALQIAPGLIRTAYRRHLQSLAKRGGRTAVPAGANGAAG